MRNDAQDDVECGDDSRSWVVALAGCVVMTCITWTFRCSGVMYVAFLDDFDVSREEASWPLSLFSIASCMTGKCEQDSKPSAVCVYVSRLHDASCMLSLRRTSNCFDLAESAKLVRLDGFRSAVFPPLFMGSGAYEAMCGSLLPKDLEPSKNQQTCSRSPRPIRRRAVSPIASTCQSAPWKGPDVPAVFKGPSALIPKMHKHSIIN